MGAIGTTFKIIGFPFKLIFGSGKKKDDANKAPEDTAQLQAFSNPTQPSYPTSSSEDNTRTKIDLMLAQIDGLKLEYETINQRIQNIERMVKELYGMAKS